MLLRRSNILSVLWKPLHKSFLIQADSIPFPVKITWHNILSNVLIAIIMNDQKFSIAVHGGAGSDTTFIKANRAGYIAGIAEAVTAGHELLAAGGTAVDAVTAAIRVMEDNPLFNCGRGSALNEHGQVEMCTSIMDGAEMKCGAAAIVTQLRNPIDLANSIMKHSRHLFLGAEGAKQYADNMDLKKEADAYFVTDHAFEDYQGQLQKSVPADKMHGTVGAVAIDKEGRLAAGTSTGGSAANHQGRIGDSSIVGAGTYANKICAVSATGDGEYIILHSISFHIAALMEYKNMTAEQACRFLLRDKLKGIDAEIGVIVVDENGNVATEFNCDRMFRGWQSGSN